MSFLLEKETSERKIKIMRDKKAGERYLTPWLFLVWAIIGVGIVAGVLMFFSATVDVRAEEADILAVRIADCLADNGYLNEKFFNNFDIFTECNLNKKLIESGELYFIDVRIYDINGTELKYLRQEKGVLSWQELCRMQKQKNQENFPQCSERTIYAMNKTSSEFMIKILAASNQLGGKLS